MAQTKVKEQPKLSAGVKANVPATRVAVPKLPEKSISAPKRNTLTAKLAFGKALSLLKKNIVTVIAFLAAAMMASAVRP